uniref:Uncharacterized protein n=1 Tax=Chromera velia CCMP2878 TaxID=1169474 RepID=A0A0G4GV67_9ALVE|eukprot:Cvel_23517.t1-p1 / transcript=Cvel_23517.t1 / gene=Cvel_23517 / organism=Chromera_velia_CCMP2878 / gene_product=hypothetical protein / transcript_product=hypothetical protein / location=Cvel_scaffold2432:9032-16260(+) / protein_length=1867 / sequence_SO=supercontig / SO=protein_coding / is_pseudo=false
MTSALPTYDQLLHAARAGKAEACTALFRLCYSEAFCLPGVGGAGFLSSGAVGSSEASHRERGAQGPHHHPLQQHTRTVRRPGLVAAAVRWLRKGAVADDPDALFLLGQALLEGLYGQVVDKWEGLRLMKRASRKGHLGGRRYMADLYRCVRPSASAPESLQHLLRRDLDRSCRLLSRCCDDLLEENERLQDEVNRLVEGSGEGEEPHSLSQSFQVSAARDQITKKRAARMEREEGEETEEEEEEVTEQGHGRGSGGRAGQRERDSGNNSLISSPNSELLSVSDRRLEAVRVLVPSLASLLVRAVAPLWRELLLRSLRDMGSAGAASDDEDAKQGIREAEQREKGLNGELEVLAAEGKAGCRVAMESSALSSKHPDPHGHSHLPPLGDPTASRCFSFSALSTRVGSTSESRPMSASASASRCQPPASTALPTPAPPSPEGLSPKGGGHGHGEEGGVNGVGVGRRELASGWETEERANGKHEGGEGVKGCRRNESIQRASYDSEASLECESSLIPVTLLSDLPSGPPGGPGFSGREGPGSHRIPVPSDLLQMSENPGVDGQKEDRRRLEPEALRSKLHEPPSGLLLSQSVESDLLSLQISEEENACRKFFGLPPLPLPRVSPPSRPAAHPTRKLGVDQEVSGDEGSEQKSRRIVDPPSLSVRTADLKPDQKNERERNHLHCSQTEEGRLESTAVRRPSEAQQPAAAAFTSVETALQEKEIIGRPSQARMPSPPPVASMLSKASPHEKKETSLTEPGNRTAAVIGGPDQPEPHHRTLTRQKRSSSTQDSYPLNVRPSSANRGHQTLSFQIPFDLLSSSLSHSPPLPPVSVPTHPPINEVPSPHKNRDQRDSPTQTTNGGLCSHFSVVHEQKTEGLQERPPDLQQQQPPSARASDDSGLSVSERGVGGGQEKADGDQTDRAEPNPAKCTAFNGGRGEGVFITGVSRDSDDPLGSLLSSLLEPLPLAPAPPPERKRKGREEERGASPPSSIDSTAAGILESGGVQVRSSSHLPVHCAATANREEGPSLGEDNPDAALSLFSLFGAPSSSHQNPEKAHPSCTAKGGGSFSDLRGERASQEAEKERVVFEERGERGGSNGSAPVRVPTFTTGKGSRGPARNGGSVSSFETLHGAPSEGSGALAGGGVMMPARDHAEPGPFLRSGAEREIGTEGGRECREGEGGSCCAELPVGGANTTEGDQMVEREKDDQFIVVSADVSPSFHMNSRHPERAFESLYNGGDHEEREMGESKAQRDPMTARKSPQLPAQNAPELSKRTDHEETEKENSSSVLSSSINRKRGEKEGARRKVSRKRNDREKEKKRAPSSLPPLPLETDARNKVKENKGSHPDSPPSSGAAVNQQNEGAPMSKKDLSNHPHESNPPVYTPIGTPSPPKNQHPSLPPPSQSPNQSVSVWTQTDTGQKTAKGPAGGGGAKRVLPTASGGPSPAPSLRRLAQGTAPRPTGSLRGAEVRARSLPASPVRPPARPSPSTRTQTPRPRLSQSDLSRGRGHQVASRTASPLISPRQSTGLRQPASPNPISVPFRPAGVKAPPSRLSPVPSPSLRMRASSVQPSPGRLLDMPSPRGRGMPPESPPAPCRGDIRAPRRSSPSPHLDEKRRGGRTQTQGSSKNGAAPGAASRVSPAPPRPSSSSSGVSSKKTRESESLEDLLKKLGMAVEGLRRPAVRIGVGLGRKQDIPQQSDPRLYESRVTNAMASVCEEHFKDAERAKEREQPCDAVGTEEDEKKRGVDAEEVRMSSSSLSVGGDGFGGMERSSVCSPALLRRCVGEGGRVRLPPPHQSHSTVRQVGGLRAGEGVGPERDRVGGWEGPLGRRGGLRGVLGKRPETVSVSVSASLSPPLRQSACERASDGSAHAQR